MKHLRILKGHFGKRYAIHQPSDGPTPKQLKPKYFSDIGDAKRFLRGLDAPTSYWVRLANANDLAATYSGNHPDPLTPICQMLIKNKISIIEMDDFTQHVPAERLAFRDNTGSVFQFATASALLDKNAFSRKQRLDAKTLTEALPHLNATPEQLTQLLDDLKLPSSKKMQGSSSATERLIQAIKEEKIVVLKQVPFTQTIVSPTQDLPVAPGARPVELAPEKPKVAPPKEKKIQSDAGQAATLIAAAAAGIPFCELCNE